MRAVLDANIAVALLTPLSYSLEAEKEVQKATELLAPDLIIAEVANTFWKIARADLSMFFHGRKALNLLPSLFDHILPSSSIATEAYDMAAEHGHPIHDCLYATLAQRQKATLLTADKRLATLAGTLSLPIILISAPPLHTKP